MKKFVFISILFFIFAFQTKAQQLSAVLRQNDRVAYVANHDRPANYLAKRYNNYSATAHKSYSNTDWSRYSYEDLQNAGLYINAMYKAHSSDKSADSPKQKEVISTAEARRIEFSDNK